MSFHAENVKITRPIQESIRCDLDLLTFPTLSARLSGCLVKVNSTFNARGNARMSKRTGNHGRKVFLAHSVQLICTVRFHGKIRALCILVSDGGRFRAVTLYFRGGKLRVFHFVYNFLRLLVVSLGIFFFF